MLPNNLRYLCVPIFVSRFKSPYLVHPGIGEEQSGVIKRNGGRRVDVLVLMAAKEVDELLTDLCSSQGRVHAGWVFLRGLEIYIQTRSEPETSFPKTVGGVNMQLLCTAVNWYQLKNLLWTPAACKNITHTSWSLHQYRDMRGRNLVSEEAKLANSPNRQTKSSLTCREIKLRVKHD